MSRAASGQEGGWLHTPDGFRLLIRRWQADAPWARAVIVHGLGDHSGRYAGLAAVLAARGVSVVAYDQRGHGRASGRRGYAKSFDVLLDDLNRVLERACVEPSGGPCFLFGHSMGGLVAIRHLQETPGVFQAAVLSAPWLATALTIPGWKRSLAPVMSAVLPRFTLSAGLDGSLISRDPEQARAYESDPLVHDRVTARLYAEVLAAQRQALHAKGSVNVRLLFLVPGDDGVVDSAVTAGFALGPCAARSEIVELPGCRHEPHSDVERASVFQTVADWLERQRATPELDGA